MNREIQFTPEVETKKTIWLKKLADFIVIGNKKTWAASAGEVDPQRPGYKELQWPYPNMTEKELEEYKGWYDWLLRDSYAGYFRAPGMTTVYYKNQPVWVMQYSGHGQTEEYYDKAKPTYDFLKEALRQVKSDMPLRGPQIYTEGNKRYEFTLLQGNITDCLWVEKIFEDGQLTFTQTGLAGIVIHKDANRQPIYPWDL